MSESTESKSVESTGERAGDSDSELSLFPPTPSQKVKLSEPQVNIEPKICEFCGLYITEVNQRCAALDAGRCRP